MRSYYGVSGDGYVRRLTPEGISVDTLSTAIPGLVDVALGPGGEEGIFEGACAGRLLHRPEGNAGFGYDPLFYIPALGKTLAEMTVEEKNRISHRGNALHVFKQKLLQENRQG